LHERGGEVVTAVTAWIAAWQLESGWGVLDHHPAHVLHGLLVRIGDRGFAHRERQRIEVRHHLFETRCLVVARSAGARPLERFGISAHDTLLYARRVADLPDRAELLPDQRRRLELAMEARGFASYAERTARDVVIDWAPD